MEATNNLRATFNEVAEQYNRYRPHYPKALFEALTREAHLTQRSKLLEVGPGTGQATQALAKLGSEITGVELGKALASRARDVLKQYPHVNIVTGAFEDVDLPASYYDLVFSATAFHWVKAAYKFTKTAQILKPRGYLAIIHTEHVSDDAGDAFFHASRPIYDHYWPPKTANFRPPSVGELKEPKIDTTLFEPKSFTVFPVTFTYSAQDYAGLLSTYSPVIALPPDERHGFLSAIEKLIDTQFDGRREKRFAFTLAIAQKK